MMLRVGFTYKKALLLVIVLVTIFITINFASPTYELGNPIAITLRKRQAPVNVPLPGGNGGSKAPPAQPAPAQPAPAPPAPSTPPSGGNGGQPAAGPNTGGNVPKGDAGPTQPSDNGKGTVPAGGGKDPNQPSGSPTDPGKTPTDPGKTPAVDPAKTPTDPGKTPADPGKVPAVPGTPTGPVISPGTPVPGNPTDLPTSPGPASPPGGTSTNTANGQPTGSSGSSLTFKTIDTKTINPTATCSSPNDDRCKAPPGITPKVETSAQDGIETITPPPTANPGNNKNNNKMVTVTSTTTLTLYFAGFTTTVTTTNSLGEATSFATYVPPSTVLVVKKVAYTAPALEDGTSDSTMLRDFTSKNLWGVLISLFIITSTLIFMTFS